MAKNGGDLIADIDDGYAKVSNLLLEALSCMPLSGAEYRVLMFIIRRTYGWAKSGDRRSGKLDIMSANEVCDGTGLTKSYVQKCFAKLARKKAIVAVKTSSDNTMAYGINPDIEEWGNGDREWSLAKVIMRDAQDTGKYVNTGGYRQNSPIPIDQIVLYPEPVSPCDTRPDGVSTDSNTDITTNDSNNLPQASPAVLQNELDLDDGKTIPPPKKPPAKAPPKQPAEPKPETPQQKAIRDAYETLLGEPLKVGKRGYPGLLTLIQRHGIPIVYEWAKAIGTITVPEGADTWKHFCTRFTEGLNRKWEWQKDNTNNATQSKRTKTGGLNPPTDPAEFTNGKAKL